LWPNLFVVGAPKSATSSLHTFLAGHPNIFMSDRKEPHFFSGPALDSAVPAGVRRARALDDLDEYEKLFARADAPIRGESSTTCSLERECGVTDC
jgi:hypothetical protein